MTTRLDHLLLEHRAVLERIVEHEGGGLLRLESREDLVQGIHVRALGMTDGFDYRGEAAFRSWLSEVARAHLSDRRDYWKALKRRSGPLMRLTWSGLSTDTRPGDPTPISTATGPSTFAARREELALIARALGLLGERDRDLVQWLSEDAPMEEQARRLGLSEDSARRASQRALERFRKTVRLLWQGPRSS